MLEVSFTNNKTTDLLVEVEAEAPFLGASFLEVVTDAIEGGGNILYSLAKAVQSKAYMGIGMLHPGEHARLLDLASRLHERIKEIKEERQAEEEAASQAPTPRYPRRAPA